MLVRAQILPLTRHTAHCLSLDLIWLQEEVEDEVDPDLDPSFNAFLCKAERISRLVAYAARSREPSEAHVAFLLAGSLAHLFCDDSSRSRACAELAYDGGAPSVLHAVSVSNVTACSKTGRRRA